MRALACVACASALATGPARGTSARPRTAVVTAAASTSDEPLLLRAGFRRERRLEAHSRGAWIPAYVRVGGPMTASCITCGARKQCRDQFFAGAAPATLS